MYNIFDNSSFDPKKSRVVSKMLSLEESVRKKKSAHTFGYHNTSLETYRSVVSHINWSKVQPLRAGVIPYIKNEKDNTPIFALGVDVNFRELTDFGGGVSYKKDKNAIVGALREFREESLGVFGTFKPKDVSECFVLYNQSMMILFLLLEVEPEEINKAFHEKLKQESEPEVNGICWLPLCELQESLKPTSRLIYEKVKDLLIRGEDFSAFLTD